MIETKKQAIFKKNWKEQWNKVFKSFKLTTHKIVLIAIFLALTTLISLLEITTFFNSFLTIDFAITINLLAVFVVGLPYGLLIAIIYPWIRLVIPHMMPANVVGELSAMLASITSLIVFFLIHDLLLLLNRGNKDSWRPHLVVNIISAVLACLIISLLNIFYNWVFLLDLYGVSEQKKVLWTLYLPYNFFKYTLVLILFLLLEKPLAILKRHFNL
ncbi:MAG: ECF transporter S component [Spiroplasma sp.]